MAERRMIAKAIIDSDAFLNMPLSSQALYLHLCFRADDDGFVNQPKGIMRLCGAKEDDMTILLAKKFIIAFENGVVVIKHWRIHNYIQKDRYKETTYKDLKDTLYLDENKCYTQNIDHAITHKEEKVDFGKIIPPTLEMVVEYVKETNSKVDPDNFYNFYEAKGWFIGKNKMKNWHMALATWEKNIKNDVTTGFKKKNVIEYKYEYVEGEKLTDDEQREANELAARLLKQQDK